MDLIRKEIKILSPRLTMRQMDLNDFDDVAEMLRDSRVMYAWEKTFSDEEIQDWIRKQMARYQSDGAGYFLAVDRSNGQAVGQIGLIKENIAGKTCWALGYMLKHPYWKQGYAYEGAKACMNYAFTVLKTDKLYCDIRPQNLASRHVAQRLGMEQTGDFIKRYDGKDMLHLIYEKKNIHQRIFKGIGVGCLIGGIIGAVSTIFLSNLLQSVIVGVAVAAAVATGVALWLCRK